MLARHHSAGSPAITTTALFQEDSFGIAPQGEHNKVPMLTLNGQMRALDAESANTFTTSHRDKNLCILPTRMTISVSAAAARVLACDASVGASGQWGKTEIDRHPPIYAFIGARSNAGLAILPRCNRDA